MKQYVIDELRYPDYEALKSYCDESLQESGVDGIYWLELESDMLTELQASHGECGPHYIAIELNEQRLSCELLIRARNRIRCNCIAYMDHRQRTYYLELIDAILEKLNIRI